jgi:sulfofructosephosphate aldolase
MELCRSAGVPGIVEGVVRPRDIAEWSDDARNEALVRAAADFVAVRPDLYKAEVPSYGRGDLGVVTEVSGEITQALDCPWVVLSSGVHAEDFPAAVVACKEGGASGFLAGRAVWADAFSAPDTEEFLASEGTARLRRIKNAGQ